MLSELHQFKLPETVIFGWGATERVGEQARRFGRRALLISGSTATKSSSRHISEALKAEGVEVTTFDRIESEPTAAVVEAAVGVVRESGCEVVVGVGGGSPLDVGKAAAGLAPLEKPFIEYLRGKAKIDRPGVPFIAIPTTAGTAAEITRNAVFLDEENTVKLAVRSDFLLPKVALVDPELTMTMPPALTAASGMDALSHAVESFVSTRANPVSEALSARAIFLIVGAIRQAYADGTNRQAREDMCMASMIAGMAFSNVGCGAAHALAHVVGPAFNLSHGAACGLLLPYVLGFNLPVCRDKVQRIGHFLSGRPRQELAPEQAVDMIFELLAKLQLPSALTHPDWSKTDLVFLVPGAMLSGALQTNPRPVQETDLLAILQRAFRGRA